MSELKALPCPFCGGEAETIMGPVPCKWGVRCINCDVWRDDRCDSEGDAIASWNRRALPARGVGVKPLSAKQIRQLAAELHQVKETVVAGQCFLTLSDGSLSAMQTLVAAFAPTDAAHVNETPKSEHDAGNVLTDAALEVTAINRGQSIALLSDGQTIPITTWLDADGECGAGTATTCVCGPDAGGRWYAVDLAGFDDTVTQ